MTITAITKRVNNKSVSLAPDVIPKIQGVVAFVGVSAKVHVMSDQGIVKDANNNVSLWKDISGNNNHLYQDIASLQPAVVPFGSGPSVAFKNSIKGAALNRGFTDDRGSTTIVISRGVGNNKISMALMPASPTLQNAHFYYNKTIGWISNAFGSVGQTKGWTLPLSLSSTSLKVLGFDIQFYSNFKALLFQNYTQYNINFHTTDAIYFTGPVGIPGMGFAGTSTSLTDEYVYEYAVFDRILTSSEMYSIYTYATSKYGA